MSEQTDDGWGRFHPFSPVLRGGLVLLGILGWAVSTFVDDLIASVTGGGPGGGAAGEADQIVGHPLIATGLALLAVLGALALGAASWWVTRYRLGPSTLEVRTGLLFRQHRELRYAQIQAVDTRVPLLARLVGLAEVRVESAGGGDSHVNLAYLGRWEADDLRERIVGLAEDAGAEPSSATTFAGPDDDEVETTPSHPSPTAGPSGALLLRMPLPRLVLSMLLSVGTIITGVMAMAALVLVLAVGPEALTGMAAPLIFAAVGFGRHLLTWANLVVRRQGDTLRSQHGLTDLATSTVPLRRVQAVELVQPLLWRRPGWWRVSVNIAGVKVGGDDVADDGVLVPAATRDEATALVDALAADGAAATMSVMDHGLPDEAVRCPPSARRLDPWSWRRRGILLADEVAVVRGGRTARVVTVVPWGRIQSVTVRQGPVDRRLGLADVLLVSTVGAVHPLVEHLAADDAVRVAEGVRRRASLARAARRRDDAHAGRGMVEWTPTAPTQPDREG